MNWLDLILIVLVIGAFIHGFRLGAVVQVLAYGGLLLGFGLGALALPFVTPLVHSATAKQVLTLVVVFGLAIAFSMVGRIIGVRIHPVLHRTPLAVIDSGAGSPVRRDDLLVRLPYWAGPVPRVTFVVCWLPEGPT